MERERGIKVMAKGDGRGDSRGRSERRGRSESRRRSKGKDKGKGQGNGQMNKSSDSTSAKSQDAPLAIRQAACRPWWGSDHLKGHASLGDNCPYFHHGVDVVELIKEAEEACERTREKQDEERRG